MFVSPTDSVGTMNFYPVAGALQGNIDLSGFSSKDAAWNLDFNNKPQSGAFYGAYSGEGTNPGWKLALDIKEIGTVGIKDFKKLPKNKKSISLNTTKGYIEFSTSYTTSVSLDIYSITGRHIVPLLRNNLVKGKYTIPIPSGLLSGGMYLVRLRAEKEVISRRMVLVD